MRRPAFLFAVAGAILLIHLGCRVAGLEEHASVLAGLPKSDASWLLGPLHVLFTLATVAVSPILGIAATLETVLLLRTRREVG